MLYVPLIYPALQKKAVDFGTRSTSDVVQSPLNPRSPLIRICNSEILFSLLIDTGIRIFLTVISYVRLMVSTLQTPLDVKTV